MIPHKTYIPHIPALVYLVCFYRQSLLPSDHFNGIIFPQFSALHHFIFNFYNTNLNLNRMCYSIFQIFLLIFNKKKKILQSDIYTASNFSTPAIFFEKKMEPMLVIHNISIATDDDIIQFGDDVNIYPVFGNSTMTTECTL